MSETATDTFWKSDTVRAGLGTIVGLCVAGLVAVLSWLVSTTYEIKTEAAVRAFGVEKLTTDVEEIKRDVKTLLERKP